MKLIMISCFFMLTACTYSISLVHTEGTAQDVIDTQQDAKADVSPTVSIPAI